jgi:hypothetical protein
MEEVCIFMVIFYTLWPNGIFCGHLVHFSPFWYVVERKIWQPWNVCMYVPSLQAYAYLIRLSRQFDFLALIRRDQSPFLKTMELRRSSKFERSLGHSFIENVLKSCAIELA